MAPSRLYDQVGRVVSGRYRLTAPIGAGVSAQVYLADDTRLDRRVAVKMLHAALADDAHFIRRFRTEARAASALNHPHVVTVYDWGEEDVPYLVTEYLEGGSLRAILDTGARLSPSQALMVGLEATAGLGFAHARGFVHRDVKPANLLFDRDGHLRIADFGLARALAEASQTEPDGSVIGSARYTSPEQARGESVDGRGDVYSLALVLVEAVTGSVPFSGETTIATLMARTDTDLVVPDELGALAGAIERAGRADRTDRPDADELRISLLAASERLPPPAPLPLVDPLTSPSVDLRDPTTIAPTIDVDELQVSTAGNPATVSRAADRGRRRWPWIAVTTVLAALVGATAVYASTRLTTPTFPVPELVGRQVDDVEVIAAQNAWEVVTRKQRKQDTTAGEILSTDPAAGEQLAEGGTLVVIVSEGNPLTSLPGDLVGIAFEEATAALEAVGLEPTITRRNDEEVATGLVIELGEVPIQVARGDEIPLVVSDGPAARVVPAFVAAEGYDPIAAALQAERLVPTKVEEFSDSAPAGHVLGVSPAPGTEVARDSAVEVRVSKGPETTVVPDVRGDKLDDAVAKLEAAGLRAGDISGRAKGKVAQTDPAPGARVRLGSEVDIFLGA